MKISQLKAIPFLMVLCLLVSFSVANAQDWYDVSWQYRKALIIDADQVTATLTDFPLLVNLTDADLQSKAQPDGDDILFTGDDGTTKLDHEIESYDGLTGSLIAWVEVPNLSSTDDTVIYMYYGSPAASPQENAANVWDPNYVMVQHLEETSGNHINSTSLSPLNDGTPSVTTQGSATGKIDGADEFGGAPDNVNCGNDSSLDITGSMTVEAWAYPNTTAESTRIASKDATGVLGKFILWVNSPSAGGDLAFIVTDGVGPDGPGGTEKWFRAKDLTNSIIPEVWFHVVGVFDADAQEVRLYKDGTEVASITGPLALQSNSETVTIGASDDNDQHWNGIIDEVRISDTARSAEWIQTSYNNQNDPASFYSRGSEKVLGVWWDSQWSYRIAITIDAGQVSGPLTNFPLLVDITDGDLASDAQPDGDDIAFADINGTKLSHEIELYDDGTGHLIAWVNLPGLSSPEDTLLFMYFGNSEADNQEDPAGTWDSNYVMVQHLDEISGPHINSTSLSPLNDGTPSVTTQGSDLGKIDGADVFNGTADNVNCGNDDSLDITGSMTVEAWALSTGGTDQNRIVSKDKTGEAGKFIFWRDGSGDLTFQVADDSDNWYIASGPISLDGEWMHVVGVFDADVPEVRLYKNGAEVDAVGGPASSLASNPEALTIGASDDNQHNWNGIIDEVRVSSVARTADQIQTSYANQNDPDSFSLPGEVEVEPCESDFDCDGDVDGSDANAFKLDFGRSEYLNPCESGNSCNGDFDCDGDVDGGDAIKFKTDFGRSIFLEPCPACVVGEWCVY